MNNNLLTSKNQEWGTPIQLIRQLENESGLKYTLDIAANHNNHKSYTWFERQEKASLIDIQSLYVNTCKTINKNIDDCSIWCNPPYGDRNYPVSWWMKRRFLPLSFLYNISVLLPNNKFDQTWNITINGFCYEQHIIKRVKHVINGRSKGGNTQGSTLFHAGPYWFKRYGEIGYFEQKWLKKRKIICL